MTVDMETPSATARRATWLSENRSRVTAVAVLVFFFLVAMGGVERDDWFSTVMQGLSVGAITFLVASGLSLIFGLMDVLNLAHGELFMLGAYVGWTVYTRFDTLVDLAVPGLVVAAPFALLPVWRRLGAAIAAEPLRRRWAGAGLLGVGALATFLAVTRFPLAIWNAEDFSSSPTNFSVQIDLGEFDADRGWQGVRIDLLHQLGSSLFEQQLELFESGELVDVSGRLDLLPPLDLLHQAELPGSLEPSLVGVLQPRNDMRSVLPCEGVLIDQFLEYESTKRQRKRDEHGQDRPDHDKGVATKVDERFAHQECDATHSSSPSLSATGSDPIASSMSSAAATVASAGAPVGCSPGISVDPA